MSSPVLLPLSEATENVLKEDGFFFLSMFVVRDWQLALFEVCLCVRVFEVGIEKRQWHLSCALNIWRGFKQSNMSAKARDDRAI